MTTYYSTNNLFSYTVTNNSSTYTLDSDDYTIIAAAFNKWDELLDKDPRFSTYTITVSVSVSTLDAGVLGGASLNTVYYFGTMNFGNTFPADGNITLSDSYLPSLKTAIHNDGNSSYYHVFLHELGHILGIGSLWDLTDFPKTAYVEDSQIKYYYTGEKALQEYKNYFPEYDNSNFVGIPFEDDGSSGTMNVHPEEGSEGTTSSDDRYINGIFHPGLDTELMSGWLDSYPTNAPLSRITLGFLDDMGYVVDYSKADTYRGYSANSFNSGNFSNYSSYMSQWLSDSDNANLLLSTQFSNYVDISAGDIVLRNKNDEKLFVSGDISFNKNTTLGLTRDKLISREIDTFSYGGAVNTFGLDSSFNILGVNENDNVGKVIATNESMNTIGIGYPMDNGEGTKRGKVKVYQIDTNKNIYRQLGQDITGTTDNEEFGHSLDLNGDGTILAVGTKDISHNTLVYKYDSGSWRLYGNRIYGHPTYYVPTSTLSTNVKLNKLGEKLAILTHFKNEAADLSSNGFIQSYQYSESDASWNYLGDKIESSFLNDISGGTIDMNAEGNVIAIGYPNIDETGYVRVYNYDNSWNQIGSDITGSANEQFGKSLSLDLCGNNIAIGAPYAGDVSGGKIQVYTNNSNTWTQVGSDINIQTTATNDISMALLGNSVNLNSAGNMLIASHQDTENNTINANVYSYNTTNTSWESKLTKTLDNDVADNEIMPAFMNSSENKFLITNPSHSTASKTDVGRINISTVHKDINYKNSTYELQTGKVGIGIETPSVAFDISGSVNIDNGNVLVTDISAGNSKLHVGGNLTTSAQLTSINTTALLYDNPVDFQNRLFVNSSDIQFAGGDNTRPSDLSVNNLDFTGSQLGDWFSGDTDYDYYGKQVAINHDGSIIAFLATGQDDNGNDSGSVYVYGWSVPGTSGGEWVKIGQDIQGGTNNPRGSIGSMAMNKDGTVIATGEPYDDGNGDSGSGSARVWVYNGTDTWIQVGEDIVGQVNSDYFGMSVALNDDGTRIAIGADNNDDNGNSSGHIRVWEYSNSDMSSGGSWTQIGQNIVGSASGMYLGQYGLDLNGDGSVVAATEKLADNPDADNNYEGLLRIWLYNGTDTWNQIGQNIWGESAEDFYGRSCAINSTGDIVAASSANSDVGGNNAGMASVWKYSQPGQTGGVWNQLGSSMYGNTDNDGNFRGQKISLSDDGLTLAIGMGYYDGITSNGGGAKLYKYDSNSSDWVQKGIIGGDSSNRYFGEDGLAISGNGSVIIGSYDSYSYGVGTVGVFIITETTPQLNIGTLDTTFHHSLIVPGNLVIVDGSNNSSFGSYTTYSKENSLTELFHVGKSNSNVFNIVNSNNVGVFMNTGSTTFLSTSDESLKKDIQSLDKFTVDKLTQIESKRFDWKSSKKPDVGFIAQEVEEILPEIIEENTYNDGNTYKGIKTSSLLPLCLEKLKEIENRIDKL